MTDRAGQQLGNYHLVRLLGRGNFADVYLGQHIHLNTQAAIKVLRGQLASHDIESFLTEGRTIASLRHPHIIQVLDLGVEGTTPFLVMEYAPGGNLRQRYARGTQVPLDIVVSYVKQIAEALQYAHREKVIHRDIKPENMLLGRYNEILLSDFGIATLAHSTLSQHAQDTAGTIDYMAPEQIQAYPGLASDQYALGVVVYEWLSGDRPFQGTSTEVAIKHTLALPTPLREKVPTLPSEVERIVLKALSKRPEQRFASVHDFAIALEGASLSKSSAQTQQMLPSDPHAAIGNALAASKERLYNLPAQVTPLIGREQEMANACIRLRQPEVRVLTLTGTGGIGKTRLGLAVADCLFDAFADGVCFVALAPVSDPALVVATIAQALGIKEAREQSLLYLLKAFLQSKELLLLLDNFEQVVTAAPVLSELLAACPHLKILLTSRAVLHIQGEHEFPVPPLALPDLASLPESETLMHYPAVALFQQRAQAIKPDFTVTQANARAIAEICARLDGLPLAIELAAVRVKLLSPHALLQRLEHRLAVLTSGTLDVPARQQTLRNMIAWSYHLLDADLKRLFSRLCVFVGGCTLEAIESVCAALDDGALPVLEGVASLIDQSLLQQMEQKGESSRFVMLETIREYGLEALAASGEMERTRQAHAVYFLSLAEQAEPELGGSQQAKWFQRLEREHDNLRTAMRWMMEDERVGERREMALRLGGALRRVWVVHSRISEGRSFLERALSRSEGIAAPVRANALIAAANMAVIQNDYEQAEILAAESLALFRQLEDRPGIALSLYLMGSAAWTRGNPAASRSLMEEALAISKEVGDKERVAWSLFTLAMWHHSQGEYALARSQFEESLAMHRELGGKRGIASSLVYLAQVLFDSQSDPATIHPLHKEGLRLFRELGDKQGIAAALWLSGQIALMEGNLVTAYQLAEESVRLYKEAGYRWGMVTAISFLAKVEARQGNSAAAQAHYEESLVIARDVGKREIIATDLEGLADIVAAQGEPVWAARLWGTAESLRAAIGVPLPPVERAEYERSVAAVRTRLGENTFATRWAEGRSMTPEQALTQGGARVVPPPTKATSPTYPAGLSAREVEVLFLVARGMTNTQIAQELVLSEKTIAAHLTHIFNKTGSENRAAAAAFAIRHGLI